MTSYGTVHGSGVGFRFADGTPLFDSIHFSLHGKKTGLVGRNGSGKSTLLRLIAAELAPSSGSVQRRGAIALFAQLPATTASGGETARAELDRLFHSRPDILLLDEPTNHLDGAGRADLRLRLASFRGALLIASHDGELLADMEEIWELEEGKLRVYGGGYAFFLETRSAEREAALRELASAESHLQRARRTAQRTRERQEKRVAHAKRRAPRLGVSRMLLGMMKRSGEKTTARLEEAHEKSCQAARERRSEARRQADRNVPIRIDLPAPEIPAGRTVVGLTSASLALVGPRKIALVGPNGSGKTTLLKRIERASVEPDQPGDVRVRATRVAYLDQDLLRLDDKMSLLENLRRLAPSVGDAELRVRLGRARFEQALAWKRASQLSGGERLRATLAAVLAGEPPPELLLLDEPTNHLDLESLEQLRTSLEDYRGAAIVVSHDRSFLKAISWDQVWEMAGGEVRPGRLPD